jgi:GAF domain-containing protein/two-component sensor histidine kinase
MGEQMQLRQPLDSLLDSLCGAIRESLEWDQVTIWLRDEPEAALRPRARQGVSAAHQWQPDGLDEKVWRQDVHRINRSYFLPQADAGGPAWQPGDLLLTPIEIGGQLLGAIQVARPVSGLRPMPDDLTPLELFANQAAVALENASLYEHTRAGLKQRTAELTSLTTLSAVADQGDLKASLEQALFQVLHVSGMDAASIALLVPATGELQTYVRHGLSDALWQLMADSPTRIGEGVGGRALAAGNAIVVTDVPTDPRVPYRDRLIADGIHTVVGVGLAGRSPVGSMTLYGFAPRRLADETLDWITVAGRQIALSIENTRLIESTRRRQQMAEAVREVNAAVASSLELEAVLETIFDQIKRVVPYDSSGILLVEAEALRIIATRGLADPSAVGHAHPRDERNPAWQAVLNREVQVVADVTAIDAWRGGPGAGAARSWIGAPLIVHNEVIGLLTLDHHEPDFYTPEDARNASLITQQAAVAIDNARRFEIERERSERLRLMNDLGRELIVALEQDAILGLVAEYIAERFGYAQVDVWLLDPETNVLLCRVDNGLRLSVDRLGSEWRLSPDQGIIGHAASTGRTYLCGNVDADPYFVPNPVSAMITRSELAVPLRVEERVAGVLNIESDRLNAFSEDDVVILETLAGQIGAALAIAELYRETQERAGNLSLLFAASQELSSSLDSDQVFGRLAQWIVSAVEATSARVYIWDVSADVSRLLAQYVGARAGAIERRSMVGAVQALSETPVLVESMKARESAAYVLPDSRQTIDATLREVLAAANVASALYLPLIVRERLIGCVEIWETQRSRSWRPDEIHLCQTVANVAASAIDNARLFEVERQRRAVAETMRDLAAVVSSSLKLQPILEALLERAAELIPYDSATVFIASQASNGAGSPGALRIEASRGLPPHLSSGAMPLAPYTPIGEVFRTGKVSICADVHEREDWTRGHPIEHARALLGAPLKVRGQVIGVLAFDSRTPGRYRQEHGEIAETIANHAAVAIENAQLYQETSQRLAELETLQAVSLELIQSLDARRVSQAIADGALRLLKATAVHLFSFDAESDMLQMVAVSAAPGFEEVGQPTPRREGLTMQVAHRGQAVVVNDPENDPAFAPITRATAAQGAKAIVGLPLQVRGRVLGVMNVLFHIPHTIVDNEVRILGLLADQAATALENARLFQTEERRARQLAVVNRVGLDITSILDLDQLTQRVVEAIRDAFGYYYVGVAMVEGDSIVLRASVGGDVPGWTASGVRHPIGEGIVGAAATSGELILAGDVSLDPRYLPIPEITQTRSELALPLKAKGTVLGVLDVESERANAFGEEDLAVLTALASQLSVAVENALLYEAQAQYAASLEARVAERTADIRREQERTITILNSVADAVLVTDLDGAIVLTNPVAETLLLEDQQAGQPGRLQDWLRELSPALIAPKIDIAGRTMQAAVAYISEDDRKVGHVIVLRDITLLEEVDRLKTQFVTNVSHELRTPLTNVKLYLGLFQKGKPEKREQYLITLQDEVDRLERLISDLLDLSRLERDRQSVTHDVIDLAGVLRHVLTTLGPQAEAKRQTLLLELDATPLWMPADRNHMIQVFINLTANAINYTPAGGQAKLKASFAERDGRKWVVVAVSDNGIGIPDEDRDRVFDRFYRGQAEHFEVRGTGLGLSIVREIVNQHSGQITLESRLGKGSTFTVWLPAH